MLTQCNFCGSYDVELVHPHKDMQQCLNCDETQMLPRVWYVNAYRITLGYGGPEEGGWWYSIMEPIASVPVKDEQQENMALGYLRLAFPNPDNKSSVAPDAHEICVCVEETVAEYSSTERPHYE